MSRLIDADALIEVIKKQKVDNDAYCPMCIETMAEIIEEQPTAYDIERVVAELDKIRNYTDGYGLMLDFDDAIEIVRKGGIWKN